jgi:hypothetical protein
MKVEWHFPSINRTIFAPSKLAEAATLLTFMREVTWSDLCRDTYSPDRGVSYFSQSPQTSEGIVPQTTTASFHTFSSIFYIIIQPFDVI